MKIEEALNAANSARVSQNRYRRRALVEDLDGCKKQVNGQDVRSFCSNDYLGLSQHPRVVQAFQRASQKYGVGSGASHLVDGHSFEHHRLEEALAEFTGRERALLFSTGYMANLGVVNALLGRHMPGSSCVIQDKLNHASLIDAGLLSAAEFHRFNHNDLAHLEQRLMRSSADKKLVVVDGVFSMDGDLAPLPELCRLANARDAWLMIDDAHGFGCLGSSGAGCLDYHNLNASDVPVLMGTLGKALGTFGAFVAGSDALIEMLIQYSRTYIYTTALPPSVAAASYESLKLLQEEAWRRDHLQKLIAKFRRGLKGIIKTHSDDLLEKQVDSPTAIQPLIIGDEAVAMRLSKKLLEKGFWVSAIRPPTVPVGTSRLRITLSASHSEDDVDDLLFALRKSLQEIASGVG